MTVTPEWDSSREMNAFFSVYDRDKPGLPAMAQAIHDHGYRLFASGGSSRCIAEAGLPVTDVSQLITGAIARTFLQSFPDLGLDEETIAGAMDGGEAFAHRLATISQQFEATILARRFAVDLEWLEQRGLPFMGLVCVTFYPLGLEIAKSDSTLESVLEMVDIGGPTMADAAAKSFRDVLVDPEYWPIYLEWLDRQRPNEELFRRLLSAKAFGVVSDYYGTASRYLAQGIGHQDILGQLPRCFAAGTPVIGHL